MSQSHLPAPPPPLPRSMTQPPPQPPVQPPTMVFTEPSRSEVLLKLYTFEHELGQWAFGTTQVLKDRQTGLFKTCKTTFKCRLQGCGQPVLARLRQLQSLQHPHLCSICNVLEDEQHYYIISDRYAGGDIADWMDRLDETHWLQEGTIAIYVCHVLTAIAHCHAQGVFHQDITPHSLMLTSRLPDAKALVSDFGLSPVLDPGNREALRHQSPYQAPELQAERARVSGGSLDVYSIGAVTHALLIGRPPKSDGSPGSWDLSPSRILENAREEEAWADRSELGRDFVRWALQPAPDRPTSAQLLQHPWLRRVVIPGAIKQTNADAVAYLQNKMLCYVLSVLLVPALVTCQDFYQLNLDFVRSDENRDGLLSRLAARRLLVGRSLTDGAEKTTEAQVEAALEVVDVRGVGVLDLCTVACGAVIAGLLQQKGQDALLQRALRRFFEIYASKGCKSVPAADLSTRMYTPTGQFMEQYAGVQYEEILGGIPEDCDIDHQRLLLELSPWQGRGTPLCFNTGESVLRVPSDRSPLEVGVSRVLEMVMQGCGVCAEQREGMRRFRFEVL